MSLNKPLSGRIRTVVTSGASVTELEELYRSRYRHFLHVAKLISGDRERAHDAVQEGFAAAVRSRRSYRGDGPLEAWVWRAVVNAAKKQSRQTSTVYEVESTQNGDAVEQRAVRTWIATLPERQRLAVFLRYYADLDYRSIAIALDVEVGTVSATLSAAHKRLRTAIEAAPR
jgi:RNA polymerase sigma-70 factor (ECF subfamily)